jgi:uncharacterized protein (DUF58 family)
MKGLKNIHIGKDIVVPLLFLLLSLFMPFRLLQFIFLYYFVCRMIAFSLRCIIPRFLRLERIDSVVYANTKELFPVRSRLINKSLFAVNAVRITDSTGNFVTKSGSSFLFSPGMREELDFTYEAMRLDRGEYRIGPVLLSGREALSFFSWEKRIEASLRVVIYPSVHRINLIQKKGLPAGNIAVTNKLYEDLTQFRSVREYVPGDELKRVNWKVSARLGKLYSMEYVPSIYFPVVVLLNLSENDYPLTQRSILIERAIETAASLVFFFVGLKQEVGLITTGRVEDSDEPPAVPVKAGYGHAVNILEILSMIKASKARYNFTDLVFKSGVGIPTGSRIMVISPPLSDRQRNGVLGIKRKGFDCELFSITSYAVKKDELFLPGIKMHSVDGQGKDFVHG